MNEAFAQRTRIQNEAMVQKEEQVEALWAGQAPQADTSEIKDQMMQEIEWYEKAEDSYRRDREAERQAIFRAYALGVIAQREEAARAEEASSRLRTEQSLEWLSATRAEEAAEVTRQMNEAFAQRTRIQNEAIAQQEEQVEALWAGQAPKADTGEVKVQMAQEIDEFEQAARA